MIHGVIQNMAHSLFSCLSYIFIVETLTGVPFNIPQLKAFINQVLIEIFRPNFQDMLSMIGETSPPSFILTVKWHVDYDFYE